MEKTIQGTYSDNSQVTLQISGINDILHTIHDDSGRYVTPGDMLVAALGACMLTMIGAVAQKYKQNMDGLQIQLKPVFGENLSGLKSVAAHIHFPANTPADIRAKLLAAAEKCPVHNSLRTDIAFSITAD